MKCKETLVSAGARFSLPRLSELGDWLTIFYLFGSRRKLNFTSAKNDLIPKRPLSDFKIFNIPINNTVRFSVVIYMRSPVGGPMWAISGIVSLPVQYAYITKLLSPVNCRLTRKKIFFEIFVLKYVLKHFESIPTKKFFSAKIFWPCHFFTILAEKWLSPRKSFVMGKNYRFRDFRFRIRFETFWIDSEKKIFFRKFFRKFLIFFFDFWPFLAKKSFFEEKN